MAARRLSSSIERAKPPASRSAACSKDMIWRPWRPSRLAARRLSRMARRPWQIRVDRPATAIALSLSHAGPTESRAMPLVEFSAARKAALAFTLLFGIVDWIRKKITLVLLSGPTWTQGPVWLDLRQATARSRDHRGVAANTRSTCHVKNGAWAAFKPATRGSAVSPSKAFAG